MHSSAFCAFSLTHSLTHSHTHIHTHTHTHTHTRARHCNHHVHRPERGKMFKSSIHFEFWQHRSAVLVSAQQENSTTCDQIFMKSDSQTSSYLGITKKQMTCWARKNLSDEALLCSGHHWKFGFVGQVPKVKQNNVTLLSSTLSLFFSCLVVFGNDVVFSLWICSFTKLCERTAFQDLVRQGSLKSWSGPPKLLLFDSMVAKVAVLTSCCSAENLQNCFGVLFHALVEQVPNGGSVSFVLRQGRKAHCSESDEAQFLAWSSLIQRRQFCLLHGSERCLVSSTSCRKQHRGNTVHFGLQNAETEKTLVLGNPPILWGSQRTVLCWSRFLLRSGRRAPGLWAPGPRVYEYKFAARNGINFVVLFAFNDDSEANSRWSALSFCWACSKTLQTECWNHFHQNTLEDNRLFDCYWHQTSEQNHSHLVCSTHPEGVVVRCVCVCSPLLSWFCSLRYDTHFCNCKNYWTFWSTKSRLPTKSIVSVWKFCLESSTKCHSQGQISGQRKFGSIRTKLLCVQAVHCPLHRFCSPKHSLLVCECTCAHMQLCEQA